ncbi:unnamed protein product [Phytophthora lilii]|uniref:Unnamed protein product n=1 Tax=Phytophthora lilii TaxID=2077276 RepID=A0A9W6TUM7_9STRA|nr:unnamed protein product [Phytophthora lilii]
MYELDSRHYWRADVILCKTAVCARYLRKWFIQEGNPRPTRVIYTRHTTSNLALTLRSQLSASEAEQIQEKDFADVKFLHSAGSSIQKGTRQVLDCWLSRPDFPPLDFYVDKGLYNGAFKNYHDRIQNSTNVRVYSGHLPPDESGASSARADISCVQVSWKAMGTTSTRPGLQERS